MAEHSHKTFLDPKTVGGRLKILCRCPSKFPDVESCGMQLPTHFNYISLGKGSDLRDKQTVFNTACLMWSRAR